MVARLWDAGDEALGAAPAPAAANTNGGGGGGGGGGGRSERETWDHAAGMLTEVLGDMHKLHGSAEAAVDLVKAAVACLDGWLKSGGGGGGGQDAAQQQPQQQQAPSHYEVLGVEPGASAAEIKKAFQKVSLTCHPDKAASKAASAQKASSLWFRTVKEAYDVLSDAGKRAEYDRARAAKQQG